MGRFAGRDILVRSKSFAELVVRFVRTLPSDPACRHLGLQLLRAGTSIGANLHEADMAETVNDFCHKVNIAQKEAGEATYWVDLIVQSGILPASKLSGLQGESRELQMICRQIVLATRRQSAQKSNTGKPNGLAK